MHVMIVVVAALSLSLSHSLDLLVPNARKMSEIYGISQNSLLPFIARERLKLPGM